METSTQEEKEYPAQPRLGLASPAHNCYLVSLALFSLFYPFCSFADLSAELFALHPESCDVCELFRKYCFSDVNIQRLNQAV